jgi:PAS domain S-box-containing protein
MADDERRQPLTEDAALWAIAEGVEAETGDRFFPSLTRHLASALACQYAFASELSDDGTRFRTRSLWGRGRFLENLEFPLEGTPCESVLNGNVAHHPEQVCELFPKDKGLRDWGVESYCGVPLLNSAGVVVGHLAILDDKPMWDGPRGIAIMRIFAARARAEIERLRAEAALRESEQRLARVLDSAMDGIVTFDASRTVELFNAAAEKIFRCSAADAIGRPLTRFLTEGLRGALDDSIAAATGAKPSRYVLAPGGVRARRADGEEFAVESTISGVEVEGRTLYTLILRDVDERRRAEEQLRHLSLENEYLQEEIKEVHNFEEIVGQSRALGDVLDKVRLVATTDSSVLIVGETGTGKELIARAVHSNSRRKDRPLIKVNCAALPIGLIESELFGHEKGAFTGATERRIGRFELALGGTIFLDEIGDMPHEVQTKLLRVLQEHEFERLGGRDTIKTDVRVIAATNRGLESAVAEGAFRRDLYYRLNVFPLRLPPLRERLEDIPLLVHYFVRRYAAKIGREIGRVSKETMRRLVAYQWPGNVRELENVVERATILSRGHELEIAGEALPAGETPAAPTSGNGVTQEVSAGATVPPPGDALSLAELERSHILGVLKRTNWRIDGPSGAAKSLDLNPSTLRSRMKKLGIRRSANEL